MHKQTKVTINKITTKLKVTGSVVGAYSDQFFSNIKCLSRSASAIAILSKLQIEQ